MSTSLLLIGAIAMFLAVFAIAYSIQTIVTERRQAYRTLQAIRAVEVRPSDLRNRELARPAPDPPPQPVFHPPPRPHGPVPPGRGGGCHPPQAGHGRQPLRLGRGPGPGRQGRLPLRRRRP